MGKRRAASMPFSLFAFQDIITSVTGIMILVTLMLVLDLLEKVEGAPRARTAHVEKNVRDSLEKVLDEIHTIEQSLTIPANTRVADLATLDIQTLRSKFAARTDHEETLVADLQSIRALREKEAQLLESAQMRQEQTESLVDEIHRLQSDIAENQEKINRLSQSRRVLFRVPQRGGETPWLVEIGVDRIRVAEMGVSRKPLVFDSNELFYQWVASRDHQNEYMVMLVSPESAEKYNEIADEMFEQNVPFGVNLLVSGQSAIDDETGAAP